MSPHGVHSPFVFDLFTQVIRSKGRYYAFDKIDMIRNHWLNQKTTVKVLDLGAGSQKMANDTRNIADIARISSQTSKHGEIIFRVVNHLQPGKMLELGTCLGIGSLYLAMAKRNSQLVTIEGSPELVKLAKESFTKAKVRNIKTVTGNFDQKLPEVLADLEQVDLVFIDGNHQQAPTLQYIDMIKPFLSAEACVIMDDIHWSKGMESAWEQCVHDPDFQVSVDLFKIGMLFKKPDQAKEHFVLRS